MRTRAVKIREFHLQIGNLRNHYLFMDGLEVREITKELSNLMEEKTAALKAEEAVKRTACVSLIAPCAQCIYSTVRSLLY